MSKRIPRNDGYRRTPRDVAEALDATAPAVDFLPDPETLKKAIKKPVTLRIDPDVISWFRNTGAGYQTRINAVLRACMLAKRKG